jgi:hypothetical protein
MNWKKIPAYKGKRSGFFIHGGSFRGSSGCIDLSDNMDSFAKFWTVGGVAKAMGPIVKKSFKFKKNRRIPVPNTNPQEYREVSSYWDGGGWVRGRIKIPLFVQYKEIEKKKLVAKDPIANRFAKFIFNAVPAVKNLLKPTDGGVSMSPRPRD